MITFVPLNESHIKLMHRWLSSGETLRWYGRNLTTEESIRQKYLVLKRQEGTRCFIVQQNRELVGYLQYYAISDHPRYASLVGAGSDDYGLDLFIGPDERIGRGLGTQIVTAALRELIFAQPDAQRCLVGPSPENRRAIRCYEKCGFRYVKTVVTTDGEHEHIMVVKSPNHMSPSIS